VPPNVRRVPRPDWEPLPYEGCLGVEGRVLVREPDLLMVERMAQSAEGDA
jgi:hypothetical protein